VRECECVWVFPVFCVEVIFVDFVQLFSLYSLCKPPSNNGVYVQCTYIYTYIYVCATVGVCEMCICSGGHTHSTSSVVIDANEECERERVGEWWRGGERGRQREKRALRKAPFRARFAM